MEAGVNVGEEQTGIQTHTCVMNGACRGSGLNVVVVVEIVEEVGSRCGTSSGLLHLATPTTMPPVYL